MNDQFVAAMSAVALNEDMLKQVVVLKTMNRAGICGFRFYIRGKPWDIVVNQEVLLTPASGV